MGEQEVLRREAELVSSVQEFQIEHRKTLQNYTVLLRAYLEYVIINFKLIL